MNREKIIAIKKDNLDRIIEFKTDKNNIYNYEMAKEAIFSNLIENAVVVTGKDNLLYVLEKGAKNSSSSFEKMEEFK